MNIEFNSKFTSSTQLEIDIIFYDPKQISQYSVEDQIMVALWGPFISIDQKAMIDNEDRVVVRAIPPQLYDTWAS